MKKNILTEVNRMKEIMGLIIISEQRVKKLLNLIVGATDDAIEVTAKNTDFNDIMKSTMDDFEIEIKKTGKLLDELSDDEIMKVFKKNPSLRTKIETAYNDAYQDMIEKKVKNINIDTDVDDILKRVSNYDVTKTNVDTIKGIYDFLQEKLLNLTDDIKSGKVGNSKTVPQDLIDLAEILKIKSKEIENQDKLFSSTNYIETIKGAAEEGGMSAGIDIGKEKI